MNTVLFKQSELRRQNTGGVFLEAPVSEETLLQPVSSGLSAQKWTLALILTCKRKKMQEGIDQLTSAAVHQILPGKNYYLPPHLLM